MDAAARDARGIATPPSLPLAVRAMNRSGAWLARLGIVSDALDADRLLAGARRETALEDLGEEAFGPFVALLHRLVDSLNEEGRLTLLGRGIAKGELERCIRTRLRLVDDRKRHPGIPEVEIRRPLVIVGMPRTGSTILHDILAQDPATRVPLTWECNEPSPPPERGSYESDPRIAASDAQLAGVDRLIPGFRAMHPMGARLAQECVVLFAHSLASPIFHNSYRVPSYEDHLDRELDWKPVYAFHRAQLQHLQWRCPGERWMLKSGAHMWAFEELLATYPDVGVIQTHRDPVKVATSFASLATLVRSMSSDGVDAAEVAADWTPRLAGVLERSMDVRIACGADDPRFHDVHFPALLADPMRVVEGIYAHFGLELTGTAADRMRAFIASNPQGKHGVHRYAPEEYGLDVATERERFRRYTDHYGIEAEGAGPVTGRVRDM